MKKILRFTAVFAIIALTFASFSGVNASALSISDVINGSYRGEGQPINLFDGGDAFVPRIINLFLFIVGTLSIVFIIWGGLRYVISGGDKTKVDSAKNTILYAVIGLIIALLGYAIVNWVVKTIITSGGSSGGVV